MLWCVGMARDGKGAGRSGKGYACVVICKAQSAVERGWEFDQCFRRVYFQDGCLAVSLTKGAFLQKLLLQVEKPWTWIQMKQEVFGLAHVSSLDGCDMWWISQEEGSERRLMGLICSSVTGVKVARMNGVSRAWEMWIIFLKANDDLDSLSRIRA